MLFLKNLVFTIVIPGSVGVTVPLWMAGDPRQVGGLAPYWAAPFLLVGAAIYSWCLWDFATFGRGTPAPMDAPKRLVARGLYRVSRNPMYTGVLTVIIGWMILFRSVELALYALFIASCFQIYVVFFEEPHLALIFGSDYKNYKQRVRRWMPGAPDRSVG